ncbi:MAG: PAS domain S-box protein, partial [Pseudomonadota bacterium]
MKDHPFRVFANKRNLAAPAIGLVLLVYISFLIISNYLSQIDLQKNALENLRQDTEKLAMSVSYFCAERKSDLENLSENRAVSVYFENKALGMSMEYGLKASLNAILNQFDRLMEEKKFGDKRIYPRVTFIRPDGELLVDTGPINHEQDQGRNWNEVLTPDSREMTFIDVHNPQIPMMAVSIAYFFKGTFSGQIVAWVNLVEVYEHFVKKGGPENKDTSFVCIKDHPHSAEFMRAKFSAPSLPELMNVKMGNIRRFEMTDQAGIKRDMLILRVSIKGTPLVLTRIIPAAEILGRRSPFHLLVAMAVLSIAVLIGIMLFGRVSLNNLVLETRFEEASKQRQEIEEKNSQLEKEISDRKKAEEALQKAHDELERRVEERTAKLAKANEQLLREIDERKQMEGALRESEEKHRTFMEANPDPVVVYDMEGNVTYFNPAFTLVFGWTLAECLGKKMDIFVPEDTWPETNRMINKMLSGVNISGFETSRYTKEGNIIPVNISGAVYKDKNDNPVGSIINLRDIRNQKNLEAQLQRSQKMEALGILAGGVAHDLNNVLSGIVSYPDLLLMQIPQDSPLIKPILTMQSSGEKAAEIVQDLLTLARRGVVTEEVVNLNDIIFDYLKNPEYEKLKSYHPGIEVETRLESDLLNISGSPVHLSKALMNLVSNAAEAMPDGGKIFISTENRYIDRPINGYDKIEEGDFVTLTVSDTGIGISSEDLKRIFEPFYTKKIMGRSGTGLGMAVVWGTVKDNNGYIDVQSAQGKGTTFSLYFPATRRKISKEKAMLPIESYMGKGESILVVDDVKEQREIVFSLLTTLGYGVDIVSSGEEAVEYLKKHSADLIVLDMIMDPGLDGFDTYKQILELHPGQKAIIASGFSETDRVKE